MSSLYEVSYKKLTDGRLMFCKNGCRKFHRDEDNLQVGQAVVIAARTISKLRLDFLFVVDIIGPDIF